MREFHIFSVKTGMQPLGYQRFKSSEERAWKIKASSKEGMITKIKPSSLKTHLTGTQ
jgi:hypothetical protein